MTSSLVPPSHANRSEDYTACIWQTFNKSTFTPIQITWPHDYLKKKANVNIKLWDLHETDYLQFAQYISTSPHGIGCKQSWCNKIYHMNSATWFESVIIGLGKHVYCIVLYCIYFIIVTVHLCNTWTWCATYWAAPSPIRTY